MQSKIDRGESLFTCILRPPEEELGVETDELDEPEEEMEDISAVYPEHGIEIQTAGVSVDAPLYPWKSVSEFVTHVLFSSPRLRFSEAQKRAVLQWAKDLGAPSVPSLYAVKKTRERIQKLLGNPTEKVIATSGNAFYLNAVSKAISMDFANPLTRFSMQDYPEDGQGRMSQVHHGNKMLEGLPEDLAPPSVRVNRDVFFVNELLQQNTNQYFIPKKFFQARLQSSKSAEAELLALDSSASHAKLMPNPLRIKSGGRMVLTVPLIIFMDDVSGNISKQWNKHHVVYMSNALMPREMLEKEFCVRFVSSSPHASPLELMKGVKDSIRKATDDPIITFDVKYNDEVMLIPYDIFIAGDNPMQAEECSHGGLKCNYFCRTCKVGGTMAEKRTDEGYTAIFKCGEMRTPTETIEQIKSQIDLAKLSGGTEKVKNTVSQTGTRDAASAAIIERLLDLGKSLRKRAAGTPAMPEDQDTPTEILHTILLGVVKYFWGQTVYIMDKTHHLPTFQTRLASIETDGLNSPTLGADYISLAQVMPYLIYDFVPRTVLDSWIAIGRLVVLLWHTEIENIETYLADLSRAIEDFLSLSAQCAPSILLTKAKFHFLLHLPMFIRRFGPAILFSTERYESFNHVFRLASIYSNRQAPSRDTCQVFAEQDRVKHIITGGFWRDPETKHWVNAGPDILKYIAEHPQQRQMLGLPGAESVDIGAARLPTQINKKGYPETIPPIDWAETQAAPITDPTTQGHLSTTQFHAVKSFITREGDKASLRSHVIVSHNEGYRIGKITEILMPLEQRTASHVVISLFEFASELHSHLRVPCLQVSVPEHKIIVIPENIICTVNVQHDCMKSDCNSTHQIFERQERLLTTRTKNMIDHKPTNSYVLNSYALHNYRWIAACIPPALHAQNATPFISDHSAARVQAAKLVRSKKAAETMDHEPESNAADQDDRLLSCLLSPNLTGYLDELPENIFAYAKKNLSVFKIPARAMEDPEMSGFIDKLIKEVLTKQRAQIKQKIANSLKTKMHISILAKSLTPGGYYEITMAHWARIAFLVGPLRLVFARRINVSQMTLSDF
ncbi:hypothetical protein BJ138DRAFT_1094753 [Hygrophoropsis aurantiaca]|uniref:Uncharacterized protein n=1 Tax=Hygrophoropsis aurantiaca TaxID=72124 RepID=A0ACB7ZYR9_9AGAM|nr:hypothetical protein BJ138DRAFT_1094753 [Hygrophoropsis aurantiaca]